MALVFVVTHKEEQCGVYQYGKNTARLASASQLHDFRHVRCSGFAELKEEVDQHQPDVLIYNYHSIPLGWVTPNVVQNFKPIKQLAIHHEPHQPLPSNLDAIISQNPLEEEGPGRYSVSRILHPYSGPVPKNEKLTFGTFGFGLSGKCYDLLVQRVQDEFDEAIIRFHIPFANFGDHSGAAARGWANAIREAKTKAGIEIVIDHDWFTLDQLLEFLAGNDMNIFVYENMDRGISGVTDFALSVPRPIAITPCLMFRHMWEQTSEILVDENSLRDILARGTAPLELFYNQWSNSSFCKDYERITDSILGA